MATIDVDALHEYLRDYYGTAMLAGLWPAVADLGELDALDGHRPAAVRRRLVQSGDFPVGAGGGLAAGGLRRNSPFVARCFVLFGKSVSAIMYDMSYQRR